MPEKSTRTKDKEKIALWVDKRLLSRLRKIKEDYGVPVSESINRAIKAYLKKK